MRSDERKRVLGIIDMEKLFQQAEDRGTALILDKLNFSKPGYADKIAEHLYSRSSEIDFIARCDGGHLVGNVYRGMTCPKCQTVVSTDMEAANGHLYHRAFISCPDAIPAWIHPHIYRILSRWLTYGEARSKINILDNILNPAVSLLPDLEGIVTGRGFAYLYNNFDYLMEYFLLHHKKMSEKANTDPKTGASRMRSFLAMYRDRVFCRHLPILSDALHPIIMLSGTGQNRQRAVDKNTKNVLYAINSLSYLRHSPRRRALRPDVIEETAFLAYKSHIEYLVQTSITTAQKKKSLPRRHIFGARLHLTFRGVIVPIFGDHDYDVLHLPWQIAVNLLRDHIIGRLVRKEGLTIFQAMSKQWEALQVYSPEIHAMMNDFIAESPYKGLPILFNRNPSIKRGALQLLFATTVKPDVKDKTIEISSLVIGDPNADFDGDEMAGVLIVETDAVEQFVVFHPSNRVLSTNTIGSGTSMSLPKASFIVADAFLNSDN